MTVSLLDRLRSRIERDGPIDVGDYMHACLADPEHGYYMHGDPFGRAGDFITAPDISQIFGELLGAWAAHGWWQLGQPARCALVELGPGRGTLMHDMLRATQRVPGFHDSLSIHLVEISPRLRDAQRRALENFHRPCFWHDDLSGLPGMPTLVVANEFFDALPIEQTLADGTRRKVGLDAGGRLCFTPEGAVARERSPAGEALLERLCGHLCRQSGAALIVDYGYAHPPGAEVFLPDSPKADFPKADSREAETLQAMRGHAYAPVLERPGEADVTAHVDFGALRRIARRCGLQAQGPVGQGPFLDRMGGELRLAQLLARATPAQGEALVGGWRRLTSPDAMGHLFKVLALVPPHWETVAGFDVQPPAPVD